MSITPIGTNDTSDPKSYKQIIPDDYESINKIQIDAIKYGFKLLKKLNKKSIWPKEKEKQRYFQIATTESLTCGLIMSTLVDIPWGGYMKYGCFGVYDTDAKRVFNHVTVDNVYSHECAKEMAVGVLNNSNATIAISVTGNAMPLGDHVDKLGEVFIGIAGYNTDGEIMVISKVINACHATNDAQMKTYCSNWVNIIKGDQFKFNLRTKTATISKLIRYFTVIEAYKFCIEFINNLNPVAHDKVFERRITNDMNNIPDNKYTTSSVKDEMDRFCRMELVLCDESEEYPVNVNSLGGKRKRKRNTNKKLKKYRNKTHNFKSSLIL